MDWRGSTGALTGIALGGVCRMSSIQTPRRWCVSRTAMSAR
jgi:hypothetical protein